jgi:tetratricopeptide (TPR) repeat protein
MTEQELYKKAESFYYQEGKELNAIESYKELLRFYPNNIDGWTHLSTIQHKITDFDGAVFSINKAIELSPFNIWTINQKCTLLSTISRFSDDGQIYFDEETREAHKIKSYSTKNELIRDLISVIEKLIELEGNDERKKHNHLLKLANNYREINMNSDAITTLFEAEKSIPSKYDGERRNRELANIYREISLNHLANKSYEQAIKFLNKAFEHGLDDYKRTMLADLHEEMGDREQSRLVLINLINRLNVKLEEAPESAYISQKVEVLKRLEDIDGLKTVLQHFDNLAETTYNMERKKELQSEIENYLHHHV